MYIYIYIYIYTGALHAIKGKGGKAYTEERLQGQSRPI